MKKLGLVVSMAALSMAGVASAAPVTWNVDGTFAGGGTISGSFTYDAATNTYSAVNISTTAGTLPGATYTIVNPASAASTLVANTAGGTSAGQPVIAIGFTPVLSNTPGPRVLSNREGDCNAGCTDFGSGTQRTLTGTATGPAPVPTMTEWAMILFGTILAGGAALHIQRRRFTV